MAELSEKKKSANEAIVVLSAANLLPIFKDVGELYEIEDHIRRKNLNDAKEIIRKLQDSFAEEEEKAFDLGPNNYSQDMFEDNLYLRKTENAKMTEEIKELELKEKQLEQKLNEHIAESETLEQRKLKIEDERCKLLPQSKSFFDLYLQTTGVHWDYNADSKDIKGFVSGKKNIKPFSLNTADHNSFYTANYLWDLIEATQVD
eukprot:gene12066-13309_t